MPVDLLTIVAQVQTAKMEVNVEAQFPKGKKILS
jgi:hypothetical protein